METLFAFIAVGVWIFLGTIGGTVMYRRLRRGCSYGEHDFDCYHWLAYFLVLAGPFAIIFLLAMWLVAVINPDEDDSRTLKRKLKSAEAERDLAIAKIERLKAELKETKAKLDWADNLLRRDVGLNPNDLQ